MYNSNANKTVEVNELNRLHNIRNEPFSLDSISLTYGNRNVYCIDENLTIIIIENIEHFRIKNPFHFNFIVKFVTISNENFMKKTFNYARWSSLVIRRILLFALLLVVGCPLPTILRRKKKKKPNQTYKQVFYLILSSETHKLK